MKATADEPALAIHFGSRHDDATLPLALFTRRKNGENDDKAGIGREAAYVAEIVW